MTGSQTKSYNLRATYDTPLSSIEDMESMRSTWTDSRLDDLSGRVGDLNKRVGTLAEEMRELRTDVKELRGEIGALQRTMIQVGGGLVGTLLIGMLGLIGTQL